MDKKRPAGVLFLGVVLIFLSVLGFGLGVSSILKNPQYFYRDILILPWLLISGVLLLNLKEIGRKATITYFILESFLVFFTFVESNYYIPSDLDTQMQKLPFVMILLLINLLIILYLNQTKIKECFK